MKIVCLAWAPFSDRLDELARAVGGERKNIQMGYLPRYLAPLKYLLFFGLTQAYLFRERPDVVYAQNPPAFCPLACVPYSKLTGKKLVVDHHNIWSVKAFGATRLSSLFRLVEKLLALFADVNTVPHTLWKEGLEEMGARRVLTVHDYLEKNMFRRNDAVRHRVAQSSLIGIASGHQGYPLERIEVEAKSAEDIDGVTVAITGPPQRVGPRVEALGKLRNAKFLGYLPKAEYEELKASSDFGLNITDEPYTVNHVLFEYAAASLPTISTRRPEIEAVFGDSLVYVDRSDVASVSQRLKAFRDDPTFLSECRMRMEAKFSELTLRHEAELVFLKSLITSK